MQSDKGNCTGRNPTSISRNGATRLPWMTSTDDCAEVLRNIIRVREQEAQTDDIQDALKYALEIVDSRCKAITAEEAVEILRNSVEFEKLSYEDGAKILHYEVDRRERLFSDGVMVNGEYEEESKHRFKFAANPQYLALQFALDVAERELEKTAQG